jgi:flagellar biosynthesis/type III secretory pathway protein FliH
MRVTTRNCDRKADILGSMDNAGYVLDQNRIERFEYPAMPFTHFGPSVYGGADVPNENQSLASDDSFAERGSAGEQERLLEETRRAFTAGREQGLLEGRQHEQDANASALRAFQEQAVHQAKMLFSQFAEEHDRYFATVEKEVVKLALAIAARILRRESQMDPLLLTGAVRVALGQLSSSTEVRVRVPQTELDLWRESLALLPNLAMKPQVVAGEEMRLGDCVIETAMGSVDLGIRSQLGEIERGFFDGAVKDKEPAVASKLNTATAGSGA